MDNDYIIEELEQLGYFGARLDAMCAYTKEYARRKNVLKGGELTVSDIVVASLIFDGFNRKHK